jgi:hypothetical protein
MFTGRRVTGRRPKPDHVPVFLHRPGAAGPRVVAAAALLVGLLIPAAAANAAPPATAQAPTAQPTPTPSPSGGLANNGAGGGRVTFGMTTASSGTTDARGVIAVNAPPGAVVYDHVAVINLSDAPLDVDLYTADVTNGSDGALDVGAHSDKKQLAGGWVALGQGKVILPAQSSKTGPGLQVVPVTITIPKNAEPGDHLAAVLSSVTAEGKPSANGPALNLEHRVGVRVYVTVQGDIRPGLTITNVRPHFLAGGAFGSGSMEVEYTLTNSGNVRFGVNPSVRATGPFGLAPQRADGAAISELLPHSTVTQKVTINGVFPLLLENVVVSATAVPAQAATSDPGLGTVHASSWTWLWTWLLLVVVLLAAAGAAWWQLRRRRNTPGAWGPPEGLWGNAPGRGGAPEPAGDGPTPDEPVQPAPAPDGGDLPEREPVR